MSIQISLKAAGLNIVATLKDEALPEVISIAQKFRIEDTLSLSKAPGASDDLEQKISNGSNVAEDAVKIQIKSLGAAELLNQLKRESFPEKILLLGAWFEAHGAAAPWRSSDMDETFRQAKEKPPANFPRDIKVAIKSGWIHAVTPRTYEVTRTGWNKIAEAMKS